MSDEERAKLLAAHEKNMAKYESALDDEQARSRDALEAKLNARRNKRAAAEHARLEKDALMAEEERKRRELLQHMDSVARQQQVRVARQQQVRIQSWTFWWGHAQTFNIFFEKYKKSIEVFACFEKQRK